MSRRALRFIHASDFHLEQPLFGVDSVPSHLRSVFVDAPYQAAEQVFEAAVAEQVDFVVLSGDITHPHRAGPRALEFLIEQFQRLQQRGIHVYWIAGGVDRPSAWPRNMTMPRTVHVFSEENAGAVTHRNREQPIARITGLPSKGKVKVRGGELIGDGTVFHIVGAYGRCNPKSLQRPDVDYWALGGRHQKKTLFTSPGVGHYCGSPQGRQPSEDGAFGCTLVDIDENATVHRQSVQTDIVRWHTEHLPLPDHADQRQLLQIMSDRTRELTAGSGSRQLLITWLLSDGDQLSDTASDQLMGRLRAGRVREEMLQSLRDEFGRAWTIGIEIEPPTVLPSSWYEEDTVLGDLLRRVQEFQKDEDRMIEMDLWGKGSSLSAQMEQAIEVSTLEQREYLLRQVAAFGVDILRGDRVLSDDFVVDAKAGEL